jgi:hypothetical protein
MQLRTCIMSLVGALAVSAMTTAAQAAPLRGPAPPGASSLSIEKAAATCWWRKGKRRCSYGYRTYGYPEAYRTGSGRWWGEMDREGRGGRGRR